MPTTMLIVEKAITQHDLDYVVSLHEENPEDGIAPENYVVVVPVGKENGKVLATLDDLALGNFKGAEDDSHDEPLNEAVVEARATMTATVEAFQHAGKQAAGELLVGPPVDGLKALAAKHGVDEIIVLTVPHLVEEFFHRDLATRLRKATDLPTLRLMAHVNLD
ncbi:MAG: indole-3-glycerol phosphate synthase [Catenulispora sp.]|nr:indole-3-glycerol phosphate synthase [Catenulispora sp.]